MAEITLIEYLRLLDSSGSSVDSQLLEKKVKTI